MAKEKVNEWAVLIGLVVIALLFKYSGFIGAAYEPLDDFVIIEDFSGAPPSFVTSSQYNKPTNSQVINHTSELLQIDYITPQWAGMVDTSGTENCPIPFVSGGALNYKYLQRGTGSAAWKYNPKLTIKYNLKDLDFKTKLKVVFPHSGNAPEGSVTLRFYLGGILFSTQTIIETYFTETRTFGIETKSHPYYRDLIDVYLNGDYLGTYNITFSQVYLSVDSSCSGISGNFEDYVTFVLDDIKSRVHFNCEIGPNEVLVSETYTSGQVIHQTGNPPRLSSDGCEVRKICLAHPAFLTNSAGTMADYTAEIYQELAQGRSLTVPTDQTWQLFFISIKDSTGRCKEYIPSGGSTQMASVNVPLPSGAFTTWGPISPGISVTYRTETIPITNFPSIFQARFYFDFVDSAGATNIGEELAVLKK